MTNAGCDSEPQPVVRSRRSFAVVRLGHRRHIGLERHCQKMKPSSSSRVVASSEFPSAASLFRDGLYCLEEELRNNGHLFQLDCWTNTVFVSSLTSRLNLNYCNCQCYCQMLHE